MEDCISDIKEWITRGNVFTKAILLYLVWNNLRFQGLLGLWMKFMMLVSTCMFWVLLIDRQLSFVCDTEATVHTEGLVLTALANGMAPQQSPH